MTIFETLLWVGFQLNILHSFVVKVCVFSEIKGKGERFIRSKWKPESVKMLIVVEAEQLIQHSASLYCTLVDKVTKPAVYCKTLSFIATALITTQFIATISTLFVYQ